MSGNSPVAAALLAGLVAAGVAHADCVRHKPAPPAAGTAPAFDGPGSFGALHDTVTLDCLRYVGSLERGGQEHVLIRDETGVVHRLKAGDYIGENAGVIRRIDAEYIHIEQIVKRGAELQSFVVKFPKRP